MLHIYTHNPNSEGARELAAALGIRRIRHEGSTYRGREGRTVINWGSGSVPDAVRGSRILNSPDAVRGVSNKLQFFQKCSNYRAGRQDGAPRIPEYTTDRAVAREWLNAGAKVVARATLNGHSGEGITILEGAGVDIPAVPLYTKYVPKREEWRIHVFRDGENLTVIDRQRKIRNPDYEGEINWQVRNHANGFIFARDVDPPNPDVIHQAVQALIVSGLDFGAVDVIWNQHQGAAYVLEINSAPGLTGQTVQSYADAFRRFV